jgi:hypothetical protein
LVEVNELFNALMHKAFKGGLAIRDDLPKALGPQDAAHSEPEMLDDCSGS